MKTILSVLFGLSVAIGTTAQVPLLNSYPSARATIFLDFDGQYVTGTSWNWSGPINAQPSGFSVDGMTQIFNRVSEDYRIFNINVTTDSTIYAAAPARQRIRVIITPTYQWYGSVGGIAFVGSFAWGDNTPCWVFSSLLGNNAKYVAEAVSHEAGHTLGLQHQSAYSPACAKTEYNPGNGTGETSWAPIMGVGYYKNLTTWHYGTNTYACNYYQDDLAIISNGTNNFGYRTDDIGDLHTNATSVGFTTTGFTTTGLINSGADKDVFKFTLSSPTYIHLSAVPQNVGTVGIYSNAGANLDIKLSLLDYKGDTIAKYSPDNMVTAGLDSNLNNGTYYVVVEGTANANLVDNSSVGYYSIAASPITTLPIHRLTLSGKATGGMHNLNWVFEADEDVKHIIIESSNDGVHFETLAQVSEATKTFSWKPLTDNAPFYRIRVVTTADDRSYYSNIITLRERGDANATVRVMNTIVSNSIVVNADKECNYQVVDGTGRLLQRGQLISGTNNIDITTAQKGLILLRVQGVQETTTWKLVKQ
ncbi:T9SS type A sorting domain-containing protein [Niastella caeni]|uniref:T9SS type A sorting domain-containing protein n=1 Tax=Niastella caeni TaxID=2569763 RepID=A0A4S8HES8_9BACT|nr:T9SS type A sorting domain-containing protein [Niastella caeni]THU33507.1 T9SS type A sorting domain-containing protein [Niastella caeni]